MRTRVGVVAAIAVAIVAWMSVNYAEAAPARPVVTNRATYRLVEAAASTAREPRAPRSVGHVYRALRYGPESRQQLDLYVPARSRFPGPWPTILWLHSGGWRSSDRSETTPLVQRELDRGFAVASVDYGLAPEVRFPTPVADVKLAVRWTKAMGARYGLDSKTVFVAGGSAGGYLAAMVGATPGRFEPRAVPPALRRVDDTVAGVVDLVGPTDLTTFDHESPGTALGDYASSLGDLFLGCADPHAPRARCAARERRASIAPYVTDAAPPIFMVYGATDELVPPRTQALPLASTWAARAGPNTVWVQVVARAGHNLEHVNVHALDRFLAAAISRRAHD